MDYIYIGKIVNTHGIKGELRLLSDFEYKDRVFKKNNKIFIDNQGYTINSYRKHKMFDMITLNNYNNINEVLFLKGKKVYFKRSDLNLNGNYLIQDLINLDVYFDNKLIGKITDINTSKNPLITINNNKYVPYNPNFIDKVNLEEKKVILKNCGGLL